MGDLFSVTRLKLPNRQYNEHSVVRACVHLGPRLRPRAIHSSMLRCCLLVCTRFHVTDASTYLRYQSYSYDTPPKDTACRFFIISRSFLPQTVNGKILSGTSARPGGADHSVPMLVRGEGGVKTSESHVTAASGLRCDALGILDPLGGSWTAGSDANQK